jgi:tRNA-2-methylthio-N6-dimethylallyladenosine synthase
VVRSAAGILNQYWSETGELAEKGYREVTLLGQNVNSYRWKSKKDGETLNFAHLIEKAATMFPRMRIRFSTSHPRDISDELLYTIARNPNICRHIHLPAQSGSSRILKLMNRGYSRDQYLERIDAIRRIIPGCALSTDIIAGFCSETEQDHRQTLSLIEEAGYDFAYMFKYNERPGTDAARKLKDDVPEETKTRRLNEIIALQGKISAKSKEADMGRTLKVLIEGTSKKSDAELFGRTSQNKVVVFPSNGLKPGDYVNVRITGSPRQHLLVYPIQNRDIPDMHLFPGTGQYKSEQVIILLSVYKSENFIADLTARIRLPLLSGVNPASFSRNLNLSKVLSSHKSMVSVSMISAGPSIFSSLRYHTA